LDAAPLPVRVERVIQDIDGFLSVHGFSDSGDLHRQLGLWRQERNGRLHRSTGQPPAEALKKENLQPLPRIPYPAYRQVMASISKTGFVTFDGFQTWGTFYFQNQSLQPMFWYLVLLLPSAFSCPNGVLKDSLCRPP